MVLETLRSQLTWSQKCLRRLDYSLREDLWIHTRYIMFTWPFIYLLSHIHPFTQPLKHLLIHLPTHSYDHWLPSMQPLIHSLTHPLTVCSPTKPDKYPSIHLSTQPFALSSTYPPLTPSIHPWSTTYLPIHPSRHLCSHPSRLDTCLGSDGTKPIVILNALENVLCKVKNEKQGWDSRGVYCIPRRGLGAELLSRAIAVTAMDEHLYMAGTSMAMTPCMSGMECIYPVRVSVS